MDTKASRAFYLPNETNAMPRNPFNILVAAALLFVATMCEGQGNVGINNPAPHASALLDLTSTNKGLLTPRMTTVQRTAIATPATGLLVFDTSLNAFWYYDGAAWVPLATGSGSGWSTTGNAGTNPATNFLGTTDNQALRFRVNGQHAGRLDPAGGNSTFGLNAGALITGTGNTFVGSGSGAANASGSNNVFVGAGTGATNTWGSENAYLGAGAGSNTSWGAMNTIVGHDAGRSATANQNTLVGDRCGYSTTTGGLNTFMGKSAGYWNTTGSYNTFLGNQAGFFNSTAEFNTFVGFGAGYANTTGAENAFFGASAGGANTTGANNTFVGSDAGDANTLGSANTFMGREAGTSNTVGTWNTFIGGNAGSNNTTANSNTMVGWGAGFSTTTGASNTFLGVGSGTANTVGSSNTYVGSNAGGVANLNKAAAIGFNAQVTQNNSLALGGTGADAVKVGIGTTAPAAELEVNGFTMLGSNAPKVKMLKLTGTTAASQGAFVALPHGLNAAKILAVNVLVESAPGSNWMAPDFTHVAGYQYEYMVHFLNIVIYNSATNSANILGKPIKVLITYEQ